MKSIRRWSLAPKIILVVGVAMSFVFFLHSYSTINNFYKVAEPLISRDIDNSLSQSHILFNNLYKQTLADADIIRANSALANYVDFISLDDVEGANAELVAVEQYLTSLATTKPRYIKVEVHTSIEPIISLKEGHVVENKKIELPHFGFQLPKKHVYVDFKKLTEEKDRTKFILDLVVETKAYDPLFETDNTALYVLISFDITEQVSQLISSLDASDMLLSIAHNGQSILPFDPKAKVNNEGWIRKAETNELIQLALSVAVKRANAFVLVNKIRLNILILAALLMAAIIFSQFYAIQHLIGKPLTQLVLFMKQQSKNAKLASSRYTTNSEDEIGTFARGLNEMLDQIDERQKALALSERRLELALWGSGEGLWEYDVKTRDIYIDQITQELLGVQTQKLTLSIPIFLNFVHEEDKAEMFEYLSSFDEAPRSTFKIAFRLQTTQGKVYLESKGKLEHTSSDGISNKLVGTISDITERRQSEEKIRLYAKTFDSSSNAILILDNERNVLAANDAFTRITGTSEAHCLGKKPSFMSNEEESSFNMDDFEDEIEQHGVFKSEILGSKLDGTQFVKDLIINVVKDASGVLSHYVCAFSDITAKKKSEMDLWNMANYDILTGLPNRGFFRNQLIDIMSIAKDEEKNITLFFIDLDRFKQVNDALGHEVGDELLKKVSSILRQYTRKSDHLARLGGDEFAVVLDAGFDKEKITELAKRLITKFDAGLHVNGKDTGIGISIGISMYPKDANDIDTLIHFADTAMYVAKASKSNSFRFFESSMSEHINRRNLIEKELRLAIVQDSLEFYFQPKIDIQNNTVSGFEALSRWFHPELGTIYPDEFISIAEESGLIVQIGRSITRKSCLQLLEWHKQGYTDMSVAINISAKQFLLSNVVADIRQILKEFDISPQFIELELTESLIIDDPVKVAKTLNKLKALGVSISIDDFGTGYSSLSYLTQFPLDVLKIDKSFINKLTDGDKGQAITEAIIAIAKTLNVEVVAEGVESKEQLDILRMLDCNLVQGYYFSPPIQACETLAFIDNFHANVSASNS